MDSQQKAYIAIETLLIYIMTYPKCDTFIKTRDRLMTYLTVSIRLFTCLTGRSFYEIMYFAELVGLPLP